LENRFKFSEITQCNGHYAVQGHSLIQGHQSKARVLLVFNTNLPSILHRFQVMLITGQVFASESGVPHFNALAGCDPLPISP